jgi:hypothetical protein
MIQRKNVLFATAIPLGWVLLNLLLKGWHCGSPSVNLDESFSLFHAQMPPAQIVSELVQGNNPPLWELLLHAWIGVFGVGEFSARFLPTLFSSLAVFFIHRIGMEHQGIRQATLASALFTLSNYHMVFAHEARVYPLLVLLTSASFYAFQRNMREPAQVRWWVAWVASNVALLYSHYFGLFVLASQALLWLVNGNLRRNTMRQWLICVCVLVVAYLPMMVVVVGRFWASASEGTWIAPVRHLNPLKMVVTTLSNGHALGYAILVLGVACIVVTIVRSAMSRCSKGVALLAAGGWFAMCTAIEFHLRWAPALTHRTWGIALMLTLAILLLALLLWKGRLPLATQTSMVWFAFPLLVMFTASFWIPMFIDRYWSFVTPAFFLLVASGLGMLPRGLSWVVGGAMVVAMARPFEVNPSNDRPFKELYGDVSRFLEEEPNSVVVVCPEYFDLNYAYHLAPETFTQRPAQGSLRSALRASGVHPIRNASDLAGVDLSEAKQVIYVNAASSFVYPNNGILAQLNSTWRQTDKFEGHRDFKWHRFLPKAAASDSLTSDEASVLLQDGQR